MYIMISEEGAKFYSDFIDGFLEKGIEPVVTVFHWDLPQSLQDLGIISAGIGSYLCNKHTLLAHAKAWRIYDKEFRPKYNGKISLTNQIMWFEGADENEEEGAELVRQLMAGMYSQPIFSEKGGWPKNLEKIIAEKSKVEGYSKSRLPELTKDEIDLIKGTYDFYGVNYYTSRTVSRAHGGPKGPWPLFGAPDIDMLLSCDVYPEGLRKLLSWLKKQYGDIEYFITENGYAGFDTDLEDHDRVDYYKQHLEQILLSINEDDVNIVAYTAWTMIDNFEWSDGYRMVEVIRITISYEKYPGWSEKMNILTLQHG